MTIENQLIKAGVNNLKDFGYDKVNSDNILTDEVYSRFFLGMLKDNLGNGFDDQINALIERVKAVQS